MTTTSTSRPINSTETTFSYAAAASGKNTATPNKSQISGSSKPSVPSSVGPSPAQRPVSSASSAAAPNMNGSTAPTTRTSTPQSLPITTVESHPKANGETNSIVIPSTVSSTGSASTSTLKKEDDLMASISFMSEDKTASWEKQSQASSREDKKTSSTGSRTPDVSKDITLVPAPLPPINPWKVRRDTPKKSNVTAPTTMPTTAAKRPASPTNTAVFKDNVDKLEAKQTEKKKKPIGEDLGIIEKETPKEGPSGVGKDNLAKEPRDRKKSDAGRVNGYASKDDAGVPRKSARKVHPQPEKEQAAPVLPPPVTDVESWPTPEIAQDEVEKAKREKDEKDKTASSGVRPGQKWVPVPITTPYVPPILSKSGRGGRGGRGSREGSSRGGGGSGAIPSSSSLNGEKHTGGTFGSGSGAENDRSRQGLGASPSRGAYPGNKNGKNTTSATGAVQRRESKGSLSIPPQEKRTEPTSPEAGVAAPESVQSGKTSPTGTQTHTERLRRGSRTDEPVFVSQGDGRQFSENQDRSHQNGNGQGYHPRERGPYQAFNSSRSDHHGTGDGSSTHGPRERSYEGGRGRGGHRGRGGGAYNPQFANGHNAGHHPTQNYTSTPHHFNNSHPTNGQYPPQSSGSSQRTFRASRSHPSHNNQGYNRYPNPNMPPPPPTFMTPYTVPFESYMVAPNGMGVHVEGPSISILEIITQINYYFSVDNLCKDMFLRKFMDSDGFVKLSVIAKFNRMKTLTQDLNLLGQACMQSQDVQLATGIDDLYIRKAIGWETWVLNEVERDPAARCGMSDWHIDPRQRGQQNNMPASQPEMSGSAVPFMPDSSRGRTQSGIAPGAPVFVPSGAHLVVSGIAGATPLSANVPEFSPSTALSANGSVDDHSVPKDEFPDHDIGRLVVVCKRNNGSESSNTSPLASPSRPRSNGVVTNGTSSGPSSPNKQSFRHRSSDIGWLLTGEVEHQEPSHLYVHKLYQAVLVQGLAQRDAFGSSKSGEMVTLYKFWTHFLLDKFNGKIYDELKTCALADADSSVRFGLEYLFKFYEDLLKEREQIHDSLIQDFVILAKKDARNGNGLGAEKLASVLRSSRLSAQNKQKIEALLDSEISKVLDNGIEKKSGQPVELYST